MVEHINEKLNSLTKGKNPNFGANEPATEAPTEGILVVLTKGKNDVQLRAYRLAFEFLMADFYKVVDVKTACFKYSTWKK